MISNDATVALSLTLTGAFCLDYKAWMTMNSLDDGWSELWEIRPGIENAKKTFQVRIPKNPMPMKSILNGVGGLV